MLHILVPFFNCVTFLPKSLYSISTQVNAQFRVYMLDDISVDGSSDVAAAYANQDPRFEHIRNERKFWQVGNYDQICRRPTLDDQDVCITVDGDDWLPDPNVFARIARVYQDPAVWVTWGNFRFWPNARPHRTAAACSDVTTCRTIPWQFSHLRTFRVFLWRAIRPQDLRWYDEWYIPSAGDMCFMYPMLEMAGNAHARFLEDVNYVYNEQNPIGDGRSKLGLQNECADYIRAKPPYARLDHV